jgi:hypothetical protein
MPERFTSGASTRGERMGCGRLAGALVLAGAFACGGVGVTGLLRPSGSDAAEPRAENAGPDASGGAPENDNGAAFGVSADAAPFVSIDATMFIDRTATMPVDTDAAFTPSLDGGGLTDAALSPSIDGGAVVAPIPVDAEAYGRVQGDADTPCSVLLQCCGRLALVPPLAATCYLSAQAADGGNAETCGSIMASFQDSGLCP